MVLKENYTLSNDVAIPKLGLGTWFIEDENAVQVVCDVVSDVKNFLLQQSLQLK